MEWDVSADGTNEGHRENYLNTMLLQNVLNYPTAVKMLTICQLPQFASIQTLSPRVEHWNKSAEQASRSLAHNSNPYKVWQVLQPGTRYVESSRGELTRVLFHTGILHAFYIFGIQFADKSNRYSYVLPGDKKN